MTLALALSLLLSFQVNVVTGNVRIALYVGGGVGRGDPEAYLRILPEAAAPIGNFSIERLTEADVRKGLSTEYFDVIIFPGGSGNGQAHAIGMEGMHAVRAFVNGGGGYVGTCGGAFLGLHHIMFYGAGPHASGIPTKNPWARGKGNVKIEFTDEGFSKLALSKDRYGSNVTIHYAQGPVITPQSLPADVSILAWFRSEIHSKHTQVTNGQMVNTPAITTRQYGAGRVVLNSPHPEFAPHLPDILQGEIRWVLGSSAATVLEPGPVLPNAFLYM